MKHIALALIVLMAPLAHAAAPAPALTDLDGKPASLESTTKDKELVVFWASWCDECRDHLAKELPALAARPDVAVVTVNTDRDANRAREFVRKEGIHLPVLRDPSKALRGQLQIFSVPYWAVYRRNPATHAFELAHAEAAFDYTHVVEALGAPK